MTKTFFIIPGFKSQVTDDDYIWLVAYLKKQGYAVLGVPIQWNFRTVSENATEFLDYFNQHKSDHNYILGFSYGAVIALLTANQTNPETLYLCSLSPDFAEDAISMPEWIQGYIGKRRYRDMKTRSAQKLATELICKTILFYGEVEGKEFPALKNRSEETVKLTENAKLFMVKIAPHDIEHSEYQAAIRHEVQ
jgi:pimeloyl-ACP methyl ester carboxylesterase